MATVRQEHMMRGQAFVAAAALAAALFVSAPAQAQQYGSYHDEHVANQEQCSTSRNNRTVGGALIGGVLGAVLGSNVSGSGHRGDGAAVGAVAGAVAGGAIGRSSADCREVAQGDYDPYYGQPNNYGSGDPYNRGGDPYYDNSGLAGGPNGASYGDSYGRECRQTEVMRRDSYGRSYPEVLVMCRDGNGDWRYQ
jgi:hypothetical protein